LRPKDSRPPQFWEELVVGPAGLDDEDHLFGGMVGADGSMRNTRPVRARRAGWSNVCTTEYGELRFAYYGVCPDRCPTAHRAELWGIFCVLRRAKKIPWC